MRFKLNPRRATNLRLDSCSSGSSAEARWGEAQERELKFWQTHEVEHHSQPFWDKKYQMFVNAPTLQGKVLEVGCGPSGAIGFLSGDFMRVGVDPLATMYQEDGLVRSDHMVELHEGRGEELPFKNDEFDAVLCFNTLDHVANPELVMRELARVTKQGGMILLWLHVLQRRWRSLRGLITLADRMHPHHMTLGDVHDLYAGLCSLEGLRMERPIMSPTSLKARGGNLVMESTYLTLKVV